MRNILLYINSESDKRRLEKKAYEKKFGKKLIGNLIFKYVTLDDKYRKKWNIHNTDFGHLYLNGKKISDSLYRIGGMGISATDEYFMLLKYVEAHYSDSITTIKKDKPHLEGQWVILNRQGVEKINFEQFESPYITGGQVYSLDSNYYNIETGKLYCNSYTSMKSKQFIFLENKYDKDESKRGILKINKKDGSFELFK